MRDRVGQVWKHEQPYWAALVPNYVVLLVTESMPNDCETMFAVTDHRVFVLDSDWHPRTSTSVSEYSDRAWEDDDAKERLT
jgi:hypothetical protein